MFWFKCVWNTATKLEIIAINLVWIFTLWNLITIILTLILHIFQKTSKFLFCNKSFKWLDLKIHLVSIDFYWNLITCLTINISATVITNSFIVIGYTSRSLMLDKKYLLENISSAILIQRLLQKAVRSKKMFSKLLLLSNVMVHLFVSNRDVFLSIKYLTAFY